MTSARNFTAAFERPVQGKLWVRLENGDEWEVRDEDLERFRLKDPLDLYTRVEHLLVEGLGLPEGTDLTRDEALEGANLVRYLFECALVYDHSPWADEHDQFWGSCTCVQTSCRPPGENWLGRLLMVLRDDPLPLSMW